MKNQLERITRYAYKYVPAYYNFLKKFGKSPDTLTFDEAPIITKNLFINQPSGVSVISSKCISDYIGKRLIWGRTSGSTGKCSEVYWSEQDERRSLLGLWMLRKSYYDVLPSDRLVFFFPSDVGDMDLVCEKNHLAISKSCLYNGKLSEIYEGILKFDPEWMILQPSIAMILCNLACETGEIPESLQYIEFTGEYLEPEVRRSVERVFQCQTANQYGTKEVNSIAYECPCGKMHIMSDNVHVETVGDKTDEGEICVTSLNNKVMPIVRFNLQDRGKIFRNVSCTCGRRGDVIEVQVGRSNDWIICEDGKRIHAYVLMQVIHRLNYDFDGAIRQYRILQVTIHHFQVMIVFSDHEIEHEIIFRIQDEFQRRLGAATMTDVVKMKDIIPDESTGKLAEFISRCGGHK